MAGSKDDKPQTSTRLNDMIAGRPNRLVGQVPGRKRRTEPGEEDGQTDEEAAVEAARDQEKSNGLYANASPFASFADKNRTTESAPAADTQTASEVAGPTGETTDD